MKLRLPVALALALLSLFGRPESAAALQDPSGDEPDTPFADFEAIAEDAELMSGFFDMYAKEGKLWMAVPQEMLGSDFMFDTRVAQGIGASGLYGGTTLDYFEMGLMAIERHGERAYLMVRPHQFMAESDPRAQQAVDFTFSSSVVESADIAAFRPDSALVLDVTDWFVSDLSGVSDLAEGAGGGSATFDRGRSFLAGVQSFPDNTNIQAKLTFRAGDPGGTPSVPDSRYVPVTVHYTLARLPENPMTPRAADDRVGSFNTVHKDFSRTDTTFMRRYVNRWRLERGEQVGDRWRPVKPITYYIGPSVPDEYRQWFHEGVEAWNTAFEAAGWEGAIRAEDLPEGADPNDIRYSVLRWNTSDDPGYGAIGPSKVDPRTGETLDADVLFEANSFRGFHDSWRHVVNPVGAAEAFEMALGVGDYASDGTQGTAVELPGFEASIAAHGALASLALAAGGEIDPGDPIPEELLRQRTIWLVMHEVGHTLGMQHNFRSSASTPTERLHDTGFTGENGVFSSVMEYPALNVAPPGEASGHFYTFDAGSYDRWYITYAYTPDEAHAAEIARQVADPAHMYGNETGALDPSINTYDLGADPLAWGAERSAVARDLMAVVPDFVLADNGEYVALSNALGHLMNEYARAMAPAVKYIGGHYMNRDHVGDGRLPFENVEREKQEEALELIVDRLFVEGALDIPPELLQRMGPNGYSDWDTNRTFSGGRYDFPYHQEILDLQASVMAQLVAPDRMARLRDAEARFGAGSVPTIPEVMGAVTEAVWSELDGPRSIVANRRDLQRVWVDLMTGVVVDAPDAMPADARSVARWQLTEVATRLDAVADAGGLDDYTRAHLLEASARIEKALEAGLEAEGN
jgi:hypothetical protein